MKAGEKISEDAAKKIDKLGINSLEIYNVNRYVDTTLEQDSTHDRDEALIDIYHRIRPGDPATRDSATSLMNSYFFDTRRYDLAKVGRYKLNKKLGLSLPETVAFGHPRGHHQDYPLHNRSFGGRFAGDSSQLGKPPQEAVGA